MSLLSIWRIPVLSFCSFLSLGCQWGRMSCIPAEFSYNPVGAWANFSTDTLWHNTRQDNSLNISSWSSPQLYKLHIVWSCLPQPLLTVSSPQRPFSCQTLPRHLSCLVNKHQAVWPSSIIVFDVNIYPWPHYFLHCQQRNVFKQLKAIQLDKQLYYAKPSLYIVYIKYFPTPFMW